MVAASTSQKRKARTIEQIVRAQLLLLLPFLLGISMLLFKRGGPLSLAGLVLTAVVLVAIALLLVRLPARELLASLQWSALTLVLAFFVLIGLIPKLGWYRPLTVLSASMRPTFSPGDLIIVRPEPLKNLRVGQVLSYYIPIAGHPLETHRVIRILHGGPNPVVQTKGDANNWHDPWTAVLHGGPAWKLSLVIPYAGYLVNTLRNHRLHIAAVVIAPGLLALIMIAQLWGIPGLLARHAHKLRRRPLPPPSGHGPL
jgi:signal peptidase